MDGEEVMSDFITVHFVVETNMYSHLQHWGHLGYQVRLQRNTCWRVAKNPIGYPLKAGHRYTTMVSGL
jgi:hypothetical protein